MPGEAVLQGQAGARTGQPNDSESWGREGKWSRSGKKPSILEVEVSNLRTFISFQLYSTNQHNTGLHVYYRSKREAVLYLG